MFKKKKYYGKALGELTRDQWKRLLDSEGRDCENILDHKEYKYDFPLIRRLFKRAKTMPKVLGPKLADKGRIDASFLYREIFAFEEAASQEQATFFEELSGIDEAVASEYMMTISNSISTWKTDIKWLKVLLNYLEKSEKVIEKEEAMLEDEEKLSASLNIPPVVKRHLPHLFEDIDLTGHDLEEIAKKIRDIEQKIKSNELTIREYFSYIKKKLPFLFD